MINSHVERQTEQQRRPLFPFYVCSCVIVVILPQCIFYYIHY